MAETRASVSHGLVSRLSRTWHWFLVKTGISWSDYKLICKGALAATIGIALLESTTVANTLGPFGYLVAVAAIIAYPMPSRGDFLRNLFLNITTSGFAAALTMLGMYCVVTARGLATGYNGTASAVAGVWLAFQTFTCSAIRAAHQEMAFPCSSWLMFSNFGLIYATQYESVASEVLALKQLLLAVLIGFAISTGVSLLVFPSSSRDRCFRSMENIAGTMRAILASTFCHPRSADGPAANMTTISIPKESLHDSVANLTGLMSELSNSATTANREVAFGKLSSEHIQQLLHHFQAIVDPLSSLARVNETAQEILSSQDTLVAACAQRQYLQLSDIASETFADVSLAAQCGIDHVLLGLGLGSANDAAEQDLGLTRSRNAINNLQSSMEALTKSKTAILTAWHGIQKFQEVITSRENGPLDNDRPLHVVMYTQLLLWTVAYRLSQCLRFIETLQESGDLSRRRLIIPSFKAFHHSKESPVDELARKFLRRGGGSRQTTTWNAVNPKDPCHLPPTASWEEITDRLRLVARFFKSPAAAFGFRVTCATMCIAIIGLVRETQKFYIEQHLVWAQYAVSFAMQPSTGQSLRHFILRVSGTIIAVILAYIAWYIVHEHPAGAIAFYWITMHLPMYIMVKAPRYMAVGTVSAFALTIVLGNAILIAKFGPAAKGKGITPEPLYLLGAIRLATICAGLFSGWFWSIFPYPLSEHERLRETVGLCLHSVTKYYRLAYETTPMALIETEKSSVTSDGWELASAYLAEARAFLYTHTTSQLGILNSQLKLLKYDIPIGGKFPQALYQEVVSDLQALLDAVRVSVTAIDAFAPFVCWSDNAPASVWLSEVQRLSATTKNREEITLVLSLLSMAMLTRLPLPPFLQVPQPHPLLESLISEKSTILNSENATEPGYATLAVLQITAVQTHRHVANLLKVVENLLGVVNFSHLDRYIESIYI